MERADGPRARDCQCFADDYFFFRFNGVVLGALRLRFAAVLSSRFFISIPSEVSRLFSRENERHSCRVVQPALRQCKMLAHQHRLGSLYDRFRQRLFSLKIRGLAP